MYHTCRLQTRTLVARADPQSPELVEQRDCGGFRSILLETSEPSRSAIRRTRSVAVIRTATSQAPGPEGEAGLQAGDIVLQRRMDVLKLQL